MELEEEEEFKAFEKRAEDVLRLVTDLKQGTVSAIEV